MPLRRLLNVAYAALAYGLDDDALDELNDDLEVEPMIAVQRNKRRKRKRGASGDIAALMAAASLPQVGG